MHLRALALLLLLALLPACERSGEPPSEETAGLAVGELLGGPPPEGFARVEGPRELRFPADHGPHPEYLSEWWYLTGNLTGGEAGSGRHFGYQLTFFRFALAPPDPERSERTSAWAADQVYMVHFALTDTASGTFHAVQDLSRGALGLAGAQAEPFRVWLGRSYLEGPAEAGDGGLWPLRLHAEGADPEVFTLDLTLQPHKDAVLHGDRGYSRKGREAGNASYYYSFTRLESHGRLSLGEEGFSVAGSSWLDREWSTSVLDEEQVGWDWFALQLEEGRDLIYYRLRQSTPEADSAPSPYAYAAVVEADGRLRQFEAAAVRLKVLDRWTAPDGLATYPSRWRLTVSGENLGEDDLDLEISPRLANQELRLAVRYWEGAVEVRGRQGGREVTGQGYVEMTGYAAESRRGWTR